MLFNYNSIGNINPSFYPQLDLDVYLDSICFIDWNYIRIIQIHALIRINSVRNFSPIYSHVSSKNMGSFALFWVKYSDGWPWSRWLCYEREKMGRLILLWRRRKWQGRGGGGGGGGGRRRWWLFLLGLATVSSSRGGDGSVWLCGVVILELVGVVGGRWCWVCGGRFWAGGDNGGYVGVIIVN